MKPLVFMISGFSDASMIPKTNYFFVGDPRIPQIIQEQNRIIFEKDYFCKSQNMEIEHFEIMGKMGADKS